MKKEHIEIPEPTGKFQKVNCNECGEMQVLYTHASSQVTCNSCGNIISKPTGSLANILGKISGSAE